MILSFSEENVNLILSFSREKKYWHLINSIRQTNIAQVIFISDVCLGCIQEWKAFNILCFLQYPFKVLSGIMHISYIHNMALFMGTPAGACKNLFLYYYSNIKMSILCYLCKHLWENTLFFYEKYGLSHPHEKHYRNTSKSLDVILQDFEKLVELILQVILSFDTMHFFSLVSQKQNYKLKASIQNTKNIHC